MKLVDFVRQLTKIMVENQLSEKDIDIKIVQNEEGFLFPIDKVHHEPSDNSIHIWYNDSDKI